jgi:molybdopterin-guanine dinucleotide biosynthesis protein A
MTSWSAIVLTGGTNKRFGSDKSAAMLGNQTLLQRVVDAIPKEIAIVVVGEKPDLQRHVTVVREEPALGGPVAAIAAGLK